MKNYYLNGKFLLRTPLLPITQFLKHIDSFEAFEDQITYLKKMIESPLIKEAIYLASPTLYQEMLKFYTGELKRKEEKRFVISFVKYISRMSSRCTPFGLFAGCTMGKWDKETNILLKNVGNHIKHTRPDMNFLCAITQKLAEDNIIKKHLLFFPNTSLYQLGDKIRYVDYFYEKRRRIHQIVGIDHSEYIDAIVDFTNQGARIDAIAEHLVDEEITIDESLEFVNDLISNRVLVSELDGSTTGLELLDRIILILNRIEGEQSIKIEQKSILEQLKFKITEIDKKTINEVIEYHAIVEWAKVFLVAFEQNELFQTDITKPALVNTLNSKIAGTIRKGLEVFNKLTVKNNDTPLDKFKEKFYERYEHNEIPFLEVIDSETGIGYNQPHFDKNPLLEDVFLNQDSFNNRSVKWDHIQSILHVKLIEAIKNNLIEIQLEDKDLEGLNSNWEDVPDSLTILGRIASTGHNKEYPLIYLSTIVGGATKLLGRFTNTNSEIDCWVKEIAKSEQEVKPDYLFAEIVHLPESRTGNILQRTNIREYEIPFLGRSTVENNNQIKLQDLFISLKNNEIMLRSKKLNKFVIPCLGNAHNYSSIPSPIYQFLCDLQSQNMRKNLYFKWGNLAFAFQFLPRLKYHNIILHRATWQFQKSQFKELLEDKTEQRFNKIYTWRLKFKIPQKIIFSQGDNELLINFESKLSCDIFLKEVKSLNNLILIEALFDEENLIVKDESGEGYTNEFLAVFLKQKPSNSIFKPKNKESKVVIKNQRSFYPGSEWIYFKVYIGTATSDFILGEYLYQTTEVLIKNKIIEKWFYIRYNDPESHLRIRFKVTDLMQHGRVINEIYNCLKIPVSQKLIQKIQIDTYNRELERYNEHNIEDTETLFYYDSKTTIEFLITNQLKNDTSRWQYAIASIDVLLISFDLNFLEKLEIMKRLQNNFNQEFNIGIPGQKALSKKFATHREDINSILDKKELNEEHIIILTAIEQKKNLFYQISDAIKLNFNNEPEILKEVLMSYIHMLCNRIFISRQREHELLLYNFLVIYYSNLQPIALNTQKQFSDIII